MKYIRNFSLSTFVVFWPIFALADRNGIREAMEDSGSNGEGLKFVLGGAVVGASIGYIYSLYYNGKHDEKIAVDGCMVAGGLVGAFVLPFLYIAASR